MEIRLTATSFIYSTLFTERLTALTIGLANSVTTMMRRERSLNDHTHKREIATVESRRDIHLFQDSIWARQGEQIDRIYLGTEGRWMIRLREELGGFKRMSGLGSCYGWGHHIGTCAHTGWWEVPILGVKGYSHIFIISCNETMMADLLWEALFTFSMSGNRIRRLKHLNWISEPVSGKYGMNFYSLAQTQCYKSHIFSLCEGPVKPAEEEDRLAQCKESRKVEQGTEVEGRQGK